MIGYIIVGLLVVVAVFGVGFLVGKKHGLRVAAAAMAIVDTVKKV